MLVAPDVYPGPQTEAVSKSFAANPTEQGMAQFGIIVVTLGNRGGHPDRSKYCDLQYKCQLFLEFSIENAEMMENCP